MFRFTRAVGAHARRHVIAYVALFFVLGGTAYAANTVRSADIVDGEVKSVDVADDGLTGVDISERSLSVAKLGCQAGTVRGLARIKGSDRMPSHYTESTDVVDPALNCASRRGGARVQVRRDRKGVYYVRFVGNDAPVAVAVANTDGLGLDSANADNIVSVSRYDGPYYDKGSFRVEVRDVDVDDDDDGSDPQDGWFNILLP